MVTINPSTLQTYNQWAEGVNRALGGSALSSAQQISTDVGQSNSQAVQTAYAPSAAGAGGSITNAINGLLNKVAPGSPDANCAHTVMKVYDIAFGQGTAKRLGLDAWVPEAHKKITQNGLWEKVPKNAPLKNGDLAFTNGQGHLVVFDESRGKFMGANERKGRPEGTRRNLAESNFQVANNNIDEIYRLKQPPVNTVA